MCENWKDIITMSSLGACNTLGAVFGKPGNTTVVGTLFPMMMHAHQTLSNLSHFYHASFLIVFVYFFSSFLLLKEDFMHIFPHLSPLFWQVFEYIFAYFLHIYDDGVYIMKLHTPKLHHYIHDDKKRLAICSPLAGNGSSFIQSLFLLYLCVIHWNDQCSERCILHMSMYSHHFSCFTKLLHNTEVNWMLRYFEMVCKGPLQSFTYLFCNLFWAAEVLIEYATTLSDYEIQ